MPCPYFEPRQVASRVDQGLDRLPFRLPLIEEYEGVCHAGPKPFPAPMELQFGYCNHGNCAGTCAQFPAGAGRSSTRFDVVSASPAWLEILQVDELNYAPVAWQRVKYSVAAESLETEVSDGCTKAQILAFCRSYLKHFER